MYAEVQRIQFWRVRWPINVEKKKQMGRFYQFIPIFFRFFFTEFIENWKTIRIIPKRFWRLTDNVSNIIRAQFQCCPMNGLEMTAV